MFAALSEPRVAIRKKGATLFDQKRRLSGKRICWVDSGSVNRLTIIDTSQSAACGSAGTLAHAVRARVSHAKCAPILATRWRLKAESHGPTGSFRAGVFKAACSEIISETPLGSSSATLWRSRWRAALSMG